MPLADYKFGKYLGEGSFSKVFLAQKEDQLYAIKVVDLHRFDFVPNITQREVDNLLQLAQNPHPNIANLHEGFQNNNKYYLVLDYGGQPIRQLDFQEDRIKHIIRQVISALKHCHAYGIIHHDLRSENILIDEHDHIKLTDFNFSTNNQTSIGNTLTICPECQAPEALNGGNITPALDIWALGILICEMVSGQNPFITKQDKSQTKIKQKVLFGLPNLSIISNRQCRQLVSHLLLIDASKRLTLSQIEAHPWLN